jgi:outer membrane phospholipase A
VRKISSSRAVHVLALVIFSLCLAPLARGQDATLTLTVASNSVAAGDKVSIWLNALNTSSSEISWTFPPRIESKIISSQGAFAGSLELLSAESNTVVIAPGAFARREYVSTLPEEIAGQVVMEFPALNVNRAVLDVQLPVATANAPGKKTDSVFNRFVKEAEPAAPGKGFEPNHFFEEHISGYEPMYFIAGPKSPNAKFQISFAYQLLNNDGPLAETAPALKGFHIAYTQTSLWDWNAPSAPFYDTTYRPEFFYSWENVTHAQPANWFQLDLQGGLEHESNGKNGADSRSLNQAYFQPTLTVGRDDGFQLALQPRAWLYLGSLSDNPDIKDYYGYANLRTIIGWKRGLQLSALGQMGKNANRGNVQLDLTYPTMRFFGSFSLYLDVQYFNGYGESLLGYNQRTDELRVGFALFR